MADIVHIKSKECLLNKEILNQVRFGLYKHTLVNIENNDFEDVWFVVLKERETGVLLDFTPYTKILRYTVKAIDTRESDTIRADGIFLCMFLNYVLIDNYDKFGIDDIKNITIEHGNSFLQAYADGEVGQKQKSLRTVEVAVCKLARFYSRIKDIYKKEAKNIYKLKLKERTTNGKTVYVPYFKIRYDKKQTKKKIFRDMPENIFWVMLELSKIYYPELTFAIALQAFAGLRPSEICNVRQATDIVNGEGISYRKVGNKLSYFEVDLNNEYPMRKDLVYVGGIKVNRTQRVYTPYLEIINSLYGKHMEILSEYDLEEGYYPMFVNKYGKALTVKSYREKIKRLVNIYLKEELIKSSNKSFQAYGKLLITNTLSPHFLRHFFTVRLVLDNLSPHKVAEWRGDSSLDTALVYCSNKEELYKAIKSSNEQIVKNALDVKFK